MERKYVRNDPVSVALRALSDAQVHMFVCHYKDGECPDGCDTEADRDARWVYELATEEDDGGAGAAPISVMLGSVDVPADFLSEVTCPHDFMRREFCGYWLKIANWEDDGDTAIVTECETEGRGWRMDAALAAKAHRIGCLKWGVDWYSAGDSTRVDHVMQMALLGELRYG